MGKIHFVSREWDCREHRFDEGEYGRHLDMHEPMDSEIFRGVLMGWLKHMEEIHGEGWLKSVCHRGPFTEQLYIDYCAWKTK